MERGTNMGQLEELSKPIDESATPREPLRAGMYDTAIMLAEDLQEDLQDDVNNLYNRVVQYEADLAVAKSAVIKCEQRLYQAIEDRDRVANIMASNMEYLTSLRGLAR
jgi:hypothetical protein